MSDKKPNIVFFFWDNFGWGELGCYGGGVLRGAPTPRMDADGPWQEGVLANNNGATVSRAEFAAPSNRNDNAPANRNNLPVPGS